MRLHDHADSFSFAPCRSFKTTVVETGFGAAFPRRGKQRGSPDVRREAGKGRNHVHIQDPARLRFNRRGDRLLEADVPPLAYIEGMIQGLGDLPSHLFIMGMDIMCRHYQVVIHA